MSSLWVDHVKGGSSATDLFPLFSRAGEGALRVVPLVVADLLPGHGALDVHAEGLAYLSVHGAAVAELLETMVGHLLAFRPTSQSSILQVCRAAASGAEEEGRPFMPSSPTDVFVPPVVRSLLPPSSPSEWLRADAPPDVQRYLAVHGSNVATLLQQAIDIVLRRRPEKPLHALRRAVEMLVHPVAATAAHFPCQPHPSPYPVPHPPPTSPSPPHRQIDWASALQDALATWPPEEGVLQGAAVRSVYRRMVVSHFEDIRQKICMKTLDPPPKATTTLVLCSDESQWRSASAHLKQSQALADVAMEAVGPHHLHFQPTVVTSWMGYRVVLKADIPQDSSDSSPVVCGVGSHMDRPPNPVHVEHVYSVLTKVAHRMNLLGISPTDFKVVKSIDGRLYLLPGQVGVLPSAVEPLLGVNVRAEHTMIRYELLQSLPEPMVDPSLWTEGFHKFVSGRTVLPTLPDTSAHRILRRGEFTEKHCHRGPVNPDVHKMLHQVRGAVCRAIANVAIEWQELPIWGRDSLRAVLREGDWRAVQAFLKHRLHKAGVGMGYLGAVAQQIGPSHRTQLAFQVIAVEMAARGFAWILRYHWRRVVQRYRSSEGKGWEQELERELCLVAGDLFALMLAPGRGDARRFWDDKLAVEVEYRFNFPNLTSLCIPKLPLFHRAAQLTGAVFNLQDTLPVLRSPHSFSHLRCTHVLPVFKFLLPPTVATSLARVFRPDPPRERTSRSARCGKLVVDAAVPSAHDTLLLAEEYVMQAVGEAGKE